ncbi:hypothetical protein [Nostoc sp.]|uniref:hypothetical protein n=1 Tax=Nostoc sp. TaxID=1180 RepID=UPI002FF659F4
MNSNINLFTPVQLVINPVTIFQGILITNSGYDRATEDSILTSGKRYFAFLIFYTQVLIVRSPEDNGYAFCFGEISR